VVADVERAFAQTWAAAGGGPLDVVPVPAAPAGEVMLRVLASEPSLAGLYRLDQMIAALARETLWLTDAYFVGIAPYVQALRAAARDGVDVRLLVPGASDLPLVGQVSRAGYRPLLETGIRVFEWNGRAARAAAGALRIGNTVGAAFSNRRMLGPAESGMMFSVALGFLALAAVALLLPRALTVPLALLALWIAVTLLVRAWRMRKGGTEEDF
jgi:hypothetical protein